MKYSIGERLEKLKGRMGNLISNKKTPPVHLMYILDESGSMGTVWDATISGYNEYVNTLKNRTGANLHSMSLITFETSKGVVHRYINRRLIDADTLHKGNYSPLGGTPLYDAIMEGINSADNLSRSHDILVVIHTDGQENSSRKWTRKEVFDTIAEKSKQNWNFIFMGAGQEAYLESVNLGILHGNTIRYTSSDMGTKDLFSTAAANIGTYMYAMSDTREKLRGTVASGGKDEVLDLREEDDIGTSDNKTK